MSIVDKTEYGLSHKTVKELPPLSGTVKALRVAVGVPDQHQRMTVDVFILKGSSFRWPLTPMQYVILGEKIAQSVGLPFNEIVVLSADPLAMDHTFSGETANEVEIPLAFYEANKPTYDPFHG